MSEPLEPGATTAGNDTWFRVWAPRAERVDVRLFRSGDRCMATLPIPATGGGWYERRVEGVGPGSLYKFVLNGKELPDPFARFLPFGVHGPAEVMAPARAPALAHGLTRGRAVIYELHVGTFSKAGTYAGVRERLDYLARLGVTALELMPLSAFPGRWGWGYDGVAHFAPFAPYGRPDDLRALVAEAHARGLAMILDVVYNHFGPRGNYLAEYDPAYFSQSVENLWGSSPNFESLPMRQYVVANARMWFDEYGFDGLRLDATHAIHDTSHPHILEDLGRLARSHDPARLLFAEDDRNDPILLHERGMDALWADDFHHQMRVLLTGERDGYYAAYEPNVLDLARTVQRGWLYEGQNYEPWGRPRGSPATSVAPEQLVYCVENHDQVGNRAFGTRLAADAGLEAQLAATVVLLFLPSIPLLFMGQEWGASSPFLFFCDHEPDLARAVSEGRRREFSRFEVFADPAAAERIPDPQAEETFLRSKLPWDELGRPAHQQALDDVRAMIRLRRDDPVLSAPCPPEGLRASARHGLLVVVRSAPEGVRTLVANLSPHPVPIGNAGEPAFSVGELAAGRMGAFAAAIWTDEGPSWPKDAPGA